MSSDDIKTSKPSPVKVSPAATKKPARKKRWTFWRVLGWLLLSLLLILIVAAAYVWKNRYSFLETALVDVLAEQGLEAELKIQDMGRSAAALSGIDIKAAGEPVFSAKTLKIEYEWREAIKGRMKRVELGGAQLKITVDETGKIIDGWLPASNDDSEIVLPPQGLHLSESQITVDSPYGEASAAGNVTLMSLEDIKADFVIMPSDFSFGALNVKGGGKISADIRPGENAIKAALDFTDMSHSLASLSSAALNADVIFDYVDGQSTVTGPLELGFIGLEGSGVEAQSGHLDWDGTFAVRPDSAAIRAADGDWQIELKKAGLTSAARRIDLTEKLIRYEAMSAAPVTTHFAGQLKEIVQTLMKDVDMSGTGQFLRKGETVQVTLASPLMIDAAQCRAVIAPHETATLYDYNRESKDITLSANVSLTAAAPFEGGRALSLSQMQVTASSSNGLAIEGVTGFSAQAVLPNEWTASAPEGPVRLAPLSADVRYVNKGTRRDMSVSLPIEYDGPLPGGYATGFKTRGTLNVDLRGEGPVTSFAPEGNAPLTLERFDIPSGWSASNTQFVLISGAPLYTRGADLSGNLATRMENISADLTEIATGRQLALTLEAADVTAAISPARQDWTIIMDGAQGLTDDFVGEGTEVGAQQAVLKAMLTPDAAPHIDLETSSAGVKTDQIATENMPVKLVGTAADFTLEYGGQSYDTAGQVNFVGGALPVLPLRGGLRYQDGKITGNAFTVLPDAEDVDINVTYEMKDGAGTAVVDIPQLQFTPGGLQPQDLVPTLQGKIADVSGAVSARFDLAFAPDTPLESYGTVSVEDMNFGTLPGPFTGVSTEIVLTSVFPLQTQGLQKLYLESFNPGVALNDGVIEYELEDKGIRLVSAVWPLGGGKLSIDPTLWTYNAPENRVTMRIDGISIASFLEGKGGGNLTATGDVVGTIPVVIKGVDVSIDKGELRVQDGGIIEYRSQELKSVVDLIPDKYVTYKDFKQVQEARKNKDLGANVGKDLAFTALRNFEYKALSAKMNGPLDGEVSVNLKFEGRNPNILAGTRFVFDINVVGELVNLVRSLKVDGDLERLKGYIDLSRDAKKEAVEDEVSSINTEGYDPNSAQLLNALDIEPRSPQIQVTKDINP